MNNNLKREKTDVLTMISMILLVLFPYILILFPVILILGNDIEILSLVQDMIEKISLFVIVLENCFQMGVDVKSIPFFFVFLE